jgi:hypothetical protein
MPHIPAHTRKWIYGVALAAVPLLVALGILEDSIAPLVIALVGAVIAPSLALANVTPDTDDDEHWLDESAAMWAEMEARDE